MLRLTNVRALKRSRSAELAESPLASTPDFNRGAVREPETPGRELAVPKARAVGLARPATGRRRPRPNARKGRHRQRAASRYGRMHSNRSSSSGPHDPNSTTSDCHEPAWTYSAGQWACQGISTPSEPRSRFRLKLSD